LLLILLNESTQRLNTFLIPAKITFDYGSYNEFIHTPTPYQKEIHLSFKLARSHFQM